MTAVAGELESLLRPSSVAIVGASEDVFTYSGAPVGNLLRSGYTGKIFPVNLSRPTVQGLPAYRSVLDVPDEIETVVIAVPTAAVLPVLEECAGRGIRTATIVSSGFGEDAAGPAGAARAAELSAFIERTGVRVLGPNTAGLVNLLDGYVPRAATNGLDPERLHAGGIALVTQSGALSNTVFNRAQANGVGIGLAVATGGQIDVDVWEIASFALSDRRIRAVALIVETVDPQALERLVEQATSLEKGIVLLRLGRSEAGRRAVLTHSGSLAGDDAVQSAAMRQLGVIDVDELDDVWQVAHLIETWGVAKAPVSGLGVVALSGGEGALIADCCAACGLELAGTTEAFGDVIAANFEFAAASNPFDPSGEVIGKPEKVKIALRAFVEKNEFSDVLIASPVLRPEIAARQYADLGEIVAEPRPRICLSYWPAGDLTDEQAGLLRATGLPVLPSSRAALRALAAYGSPASRPPVVVRADDDGGRAETVEPDATYLTVRQHFARLGLDFRPAELVGSLEEALEAAERIGLPVVMKANVASSTHKLANGLLALDLTSLEQVRAAYPSLVSAGEHFAADGIVVEGLARGQVQVLVGAHRDPGFGAVVMFGSGGSMVEHLGDAALLVVRYACAEDWQAVVERTGAGSYLAGHSPQAVTQLAEIAKSVGEWFAASPGISSLDLNPLVVDVVDGRVTCVDARVA